MKKKRLTLFDNITFFIILFKLFFLLNLFNLFFFNISIFVKLIFFTSIFLKYKNIIYYCNLHFYISWKNPSKSFTCNSVNGLFIVAQLVKS